MTKEQIKEVLSLHKLWREGELGGVCANLSGANLYGANLYGANLSGANLYGANLSGANLYGANLYGAYLYGANLSYANLSGANLYGANLYGANLSSANLSYANLSYANLYGANLTGANLTGAKLPSFQICPQEGSFLAYKKTTKGVITLLIPEDAKRTNSLVGRKCRASKVVVVDGEGCGGTGTHYKGIVYDLASVIVCDDYDDDIRVECTEGIHFFMTLAEAEEWS